MELTILMPCLNEEKTLRTCIEKAQTFLNTNNVDGEILISDNGSTDNSQSIVKEIHTKDKRVRLVEVEDKGYGAALINGCKEAKGQFVIIGDSDDSYDFLNLMPFLEKLREGYDLVMGNRFKGKIEKGAMPPLHKYLGNPVLSFIGRLLYKSNIKDFHCGLRGYNRESILKLDLHTLGMEYASEMVVQATLHNLKITEVPTTLKKDGRDRPPHLRSWSDGWRHLAFLLLHAPSWLFLLPGIILTLFGLISGISIIAFNITIFGIHFDVNSLVYSAVSTIIGFQLVLYYILTKKYAENTKFIPTTKIDNLLIKLTMNKGIFVGTILFLIGIISSILAICIWSSSGFGDLNASYMLRITIPALTTLVCGLQLMFSSFFLGILEIKIKQQ